MDRAQLIREFRFKAVRSSGKGGQHVNKVSSKVELMWTPADTQALEPEEMERLLLKLGPRISAEGIIRTESQEARSQLDNRQRATGKMLELVERALKKEKKRIPTRVSQAKKRARVVSKLKQGERKQWRRRPGMPEE